MGISQQTANYFIRNRKSLGTVESLTAGMLASKIASQPGASAYYAGSYVTYQTQKKIDWLGLSPEMIDTHGVVSRAVAEAMAKAGVSALGVDYCIALTGFAGPEGGDEKYPVGTVFIAIAGIGPIPDSVLAKEYHFKGDRQAVRTQSCEAAIQMLEKALLSD